jgi:uncharacterized membrane protein YecN with MAPEG domain
MYIISFYAGALAVLFALLTFRTISLRQRFKVSLGDGGQELLKRAIRAHANFTESVPLGLILLLVLATTSSPNWLIHLAGIALLAGRLSHALGVSRSPEPFILRQVGMVLTLASILSSGGFLLWQGLAALI